MASRLSSAPSPSGAAIDPYSARHDLWKLFSRKNRVKVFGSTCALACGLWRPRRRLLGHPSRKIFDEGVENDMRGRMCSP
jgi:hypothetical protein